MICFKPEVTNTSRRWSLKSLGTERTWGTLSFPGTWGLFLVVPELCVGKGVGLKAVYGFGAHSALEKPSWWGAPTSHTSAVQKQLQVK